MKGKWFSVDLDVMDYREAWGLQSKIVTLRKDRAIPRNIVLFLEHPPVFTLGRRGGLDNLMVSENFLEKAGISLVQVERGGDITFHGPGQLVVYPIIDLEEERLRVGDYVNHLEEVMIRSAADWGIKAERSPRNRGVWIGNKKLGSIGIAIRRGVSFHGMAFNVNLSLEPFTWIQPCGLQGVEMTSLERELSQEISREKVLVAVKLHLEAVFGVELVEAGLSQFQGLSTNWAPTGVEARSETLP